jgi:hypothetical protein
VISSIEAMLKRSRRSRLISFAPRDLVSIKSEIAGIHCGELIYGVFRQSNIGECRKSLDNYGENEKFAKVGGGVFYAEVQVLPKFTAVSPIAQFSAGLYGPVFQFWSSPP